MLNSYLKTYRERSYLDAKNIPLIDSYDEKYDRSGELKLKSIDVYSDGFSLGNIYNHVKRLEESSTVDWDAQIAGLLGYADKVKEGLIESIEESKNRSGWAWKAGSERFKESNVHIENYASPLSFQINYTIEVQEKLQENQLKLEAVEDFIKYAESLLEGRGE